MAQGNPERQAGDDLGETSLAAATAAIITARWNVPARPTTVPKPRRRAAIDELVPASAARARASAAVAPPSRHNGNGNGQGHAQSHEPPLDPSAAATSSYLSPPAASPAYEAPYEARYETPRGSSYEAPYGAHRQDQNPPAAPEALVSARPFHDAPVGAPPSYEPPGYDASPYEAPAYESYGPASYEPMAGPASYGDAPDGAGLGDPEPSAAASTAPTFEPAPFPQTPPLFSASLPDATGLADPHESPSPGELEFTGSIISDLPFPEFRPEQYETPYNPYDPESSYQTSTNGYYSDDPVDGPNPVDVAGAAENADVTVGPAEAMLPQRVPGIPDVPEVPLPPNDPLRDPASIPVADRGELSRIATYLRDAVEEPDQRPDGYDLTAVIEAVRGVPGVAGAKLRWDSGSGHVLRIEFVEGTDEGQVTREVARVLRETMGLAAEPSPRWVAAEESTLERTRPQRHGVVASAPVPVRPVAGPLAGGPGLAGPGLVGAGPGGPGSYASASAAVPAAQGGQPLPLPHRAPGTGPARLVLEHVQVTTLGLDATVEVRLALSPGGRVATGKGHGPAVDAYLLRLSASAAGHAADQMLVDEGTGASRARCFIEHVAVVPFAGCEVAVVVLLLVRGSVAEQLSGSAVVSGDPRQAVVRATLSALNRRLESLLSSAGAGAE